MGPTWSMQNDNLNIGKMKTQLFHFRIFVIFICPRLERCGSGGGRRLLRCGEHSTLQVLQHPWIPHSQGILS